LPGAEGQTLALHCIEPSKKGTDAVLFIHGASFPTMLAAGFEFDAKDSWMNFMANRGFLACGLDFLGFGASSRPAAMANDPAGAVPVDLAPDAAAQISVAVDYLIHQRHVKGLHIVAHSWGTVPSTLYATTHPTALRSLTLFGPIVPIAGSHAENTGFSWWSISGQERYQQLQFTDVLPKGMHLLDPAVDRKWAAEFAASEPDENSADIGSPIKIPAGPVADINGARADHYPYLPVDLRIPLFVVYGSYDTVVNDVEAAAFLDRFTSSPLKWRLRIDGGTHVMHLERNRKSPYQSVLAFIATVDEQIRIKTASYSYPMISAPLSRVRSRLLPSNWNEQQTDAVNGGMRDNIKNQISSPEIQQSDQNADHRNRQQKSEPNDRQVCQGKRRDGDGRGGPFAAPNRRQSLEGIAAI
jgi:pimeloyl-ACP methyl ester carboxylesterase